MTPLAKLLARQISATGPISVSDYMAECLLNPEHGYYQTQDPFGAAGDFVTAPEVSQMFGEITGLALAQAWSDQGSQSPFVLAELGPGRGMCMTDIMRATRNVPGFTDNARVHLVEASAKQRRRQRLELAGERINWVDTVFGLPEAPLFLIANEFFDALPIRQFIREDTGWRERMVGMRGGKLAFGLSEPAPVAKLDRRLGDTRPGDLVELRSTAEAVMETVATRIARYGGGALIIDYGDWRSRGDTLQAVKAHRFVDALAQPGLADLTAHVDFEALADAAKCVMPSALTTQGVFLERLGITARANRLARSLSGQELDAHVTAHRRLTHPKEMGNIFKVLGLTPQGAPRFPGLDP